MQAKEIYDKAAAKWERRTPNILTDFAVRPLVFECLREPGFHSIPEMRELSVLAELIKQAPEIFQSGADIPSHFVMKVEKS